VDRSTYKVAILAAPSEKYSGGKIGKASLGSFARPIAFGTHYLNDPPEIPFVAGYTAHQRSLTINPPKRVFWYPGGVWKRFGPRPAANVGTAFPSFRVCRADVSGHPHWTIALGRKESQNRNRTVRPDTAPPKRRATGTECFLDEISLGIDKETGLWSGGKDPAFGGD